MNSSDKQLEKRARALYQEATQRIDPAIAGRLRAARRTALEAASTHASPHYRARVLLPVGALAAMALAALMIWQPTPHQANSIQPPAAMATATDPADSELPPGADKADPGLYQNLDFYSWLAANDSNQSKR
jgi:ferric-dicitrate binding protein FerR (iron transport regulator)